MVNGTSSWTTCNTTLEDSTIVEDPLWKGFTFHHFGLFLSAVFGGISILIALFLVFQHATHYSKPYEQRHVIRILLMIPIYSIVQFCSYLFYRKAVYFEVLGNCYEAFAIASFFTLLCHYCAPTLHEQKEYFRGLVPVNWFWGVFGLQKCTGGRDKGIFRRPRSGLTWFNIIWIGVFQYCLIRVLFTIVSVITEEFDRYCEASLSPVFAHVWVTAFEALSVTIAMFCLIQFYIQLRVDLAAHKPFLKVLCIKLVIFFSFWQTIIISLLSSSNGPLQPTAKVSYQDIKVGIPAVMLCIEMAIFAVMHLFAFPWKEYTLPNHGKDMGPNLGGLDGRPARYQGGFMGIKAMGDAFNPWDIVKASARGFRWLFVGYKKRELDPSYMAPPKLDGTTGYVANGPTFAGNHEAATELRPSDDGFARGRLGVQSSEEDDRAGLLRHSANMGAGRDVASSASVSPYRTRTNANDEFTSGDDSRLDLGAQGQHRRGQESKGSDFGPGRVGGEEEEDVGYHPGIGGAPGASAGSRQSVHPAYRSDEQQQWDPWAGAQSGQQGGAYSARGGDPHG
ncbi:hypothetical protein LTR56_015914 [Elasticomyces elasticus]|nr:hypothetical protein LTR56_015914 [Elasticomyces elasticus]KAK3655329.1 hypothetical protein LTR22_010359 [Elasticomyces elasticus]KAK4918685.1 hypothetical protein LTR49_013610 [Elasticomyces elasticus]KAK5744070.1 hypothetical protein LTS12_023640 [Elasticomyces elasticus]